MAPAAERLEPNLHIDLMDIVDPIASMSNTLTLPPVFIMLLKLQPLPKLMKLKTDILLPHRNWEKTLTAEPTLAYARTDIELAKEPKLARLTLLPHRTNDLIDIELPQLVASRMLTLLPKKVAL
jgi:hypothetical protein